MRMRQTVLNVCAVLALAVTASMVSGAERVFPLDLVKQHEANDKLQIKEIGPNEFEWSLPDGLGQTLNIDLRKLGVDPKDYDELRFDLKPLGSQVALHTTLFGMPTENELSSWYTKFRTATDKWSTGRFDLRVDDDGTQYPERFGDFKAGVLRFELAPRILGYPGEPKWRKAILRNPRLIKWAVAADFEPRDVKIAITDTEISYTYPLHLKNRTDKPVTAKVEVDPDHSLKSFRAAVESAAATPHPGPLGAGPASPPRGEAGHPDRLSPPRERPAARASGTSGEGAAPSPFTISLAAGEEKIVLIRVFMTAKDAKALAPGYGERIYPKVTVEGLADSDVQPLLGYRNMSMWAVIPVKKESWTPQTFQARVAEAAKFMKVADWKNGIIRRADAALKYDWPAFDWLTPGMKATATPFWGQSYRCPVCKDETLQSDPPNDIHRHVCPRCKKVIENDPFFDQAARQEYFRHRFGDVRALAQAWLLTGDAKYADKAIVIMLAYADAYPNMTVTGYRSTGGSSRLAKNTLVVTWCLPDLTEGYSMLAAYPGLDDGKRKRIDAMLNAAGLREERHGQEFNNQQAENIHTYGSVALATGYWPLLGEALHGDFGWTEMVEYCFSEDGIGHEGQAYHMAAWGGMNSFATFAYDRGLNLMTPRFKRIYDGSLAMGYGHGAMYELAYHAYKEPAYLAKFEEGRRYPGEWSILYGVPDAPKASSVPAVSKLLDGMGYIFLRRGNAADSWEIHLNYKEQFDRGEFDRLTTFFYRNGTQADATVARMSYTTPGGEWMCYTPAHNTIVIDGQNSRDVTSDLVAYKGDGDTPFAVVANNPPGTLYEGVRQLRGIALLGDAYVVFDRVVCDKPRTVDRYQWGKGKAALAFKAEPATPAKIPEAGRYKDIVAGPCGKEMRLDFANGLKMRLVSDQDLTGYKAISFGGYMGTPMEVTWARLDNCKEATFLSVFSFGKDTEPPAARIVKSSEDEIVIEVKSKDKTYTVTVKPKEKKAEVVGK